MASRPHLVLGVAVGACLVLGAALRFPYLAYGLPGTVYVDSHMFVDDANALFASTGHFQPSDLFYPGFLKILFAVVYGVLGLESVTAQHLAPRILASLFDLGTVGLVFVLARRLGGLFAAALAAALYAVTIVAVTSSRIESSDTTVTFFLTATLAALGGRRLGLGRFALAGALLGFAMGTKWSGIYGAIAFPLAAWIAVQEGLPKARAAAGVALGGAVSGAVFLCTTPWFLPMLDDFLPVFRMIAQAVRTGQVGHVQATALDGLLSSTPTWEQPWLTSGLLGNLGAPALLAMVAAVGAALLGRLGPRARVLAVFVVVYYAAYARAGHLKAIRYLLPILPAATVLAGAGVARLLRRRTLLRRRWVGALCALVLLAYPLARSARYVACAARPLTNDLVYAWAAENLPHGARVFSSPLYLRNLRALDLKILTPAGAGQNQYRVAETAGVDTEARPLYRPELIDSMREEHLDYVILGSYFDDAFTDLPENRRAFPRTVEAYAAFRARLSREAEVIYSVHGNDEGRLGPDVTVYRLRPAQGPG